MNRRRLVHGKEHLELQSFHMLMTCTRIGAMNPTQSRVAAEVTRYTLSLSKGSDLFPGERVWGGVSLLTSAATWGSVHGTSTRPARRSPQSKAGQFARFRFPLSRLRPAGYAVAGRFSLFPTPTQYPVASWP